MNRSEITECTEMITSIDVTRMSEEKQEGLLLGLKIASKAFCASEGINTEDFIKIANALMEKETLLQYFTGKR